ncbi:hypothetical protein [Streptomyces sp. NPDC101455]|uniref:hypothetical protein n=1 Tax=Streptomyces sp. NPDC101455 TaxID=3366142 RepID=UPI0037F704E3
MTVLRGITAMDRQGLPRRTRGGASVEPSALFESSVTVRLESQAAAKQAIALAVLQYVGCR